MKTALASVLDIKKDFPVLNRSFGDMPLHYLDSAATTQKPVSVIDAMDKFYRESYGTVRRGVYRLSEKATAEYEGTRKKIAALINAASDKEIIYTSGTTQGINLVAYSYGRKFLKAGDEIILSQIEHHANIVPWQIACEMTGAVIKIIPADDDGTLILDEYAKLLSPRTKVVAVNHVSNALGTINPVEKIIKMARAGAPNAVVLIDGAQSVAHMTVDVRALDADFYVFSGHKMFGPTGIGILYGKYSVLEKMPPYQGGGDMIMKVTFPVTTFQAPPHRFEAGTPPIAEAVGLGAAVDYLRTVGLDKIAAHEHALLEYGTAVLKDIPGLKLIGTAPHKASILGFVLEGRLGRPGVHPHDIGTLLDGEGIAIRAGHHCAQPTMERYGVPATARASLGPYNDASDLDALAAGIRKVIEVFR